MSLHWLCISKRRRSVLAKLIRKYRSWVETSRIFDLLLGTAGTAQQANNSHCFAKHLVSNMDILHEKFIDCK